MNKYNKGSLRVCASSVWCIVRAWHISAHYGTAATEHSYDGCVPRIHYCLRIDSRRARRNLRTVRTRLLDKGVRLRKEKCVFRQNSCRYLGHVIDEEGIHPTDDKVMAIKNAPVPQNVQQLRSYLGLIHYYHNFLSNISNLLAPLYELTRLDTEWKWCAIHQNAFEQSKALLSSSKVFAHYHHQLPIIVSSDASAYGIGSELSHRMPDGSEKPVAFASRSLSRQQRNTRSWRRKRWL